jgi:type IV pilus assembly protein PilN
MYSLDINLLRERTEYQTGPQSEFINNTNISAPTPKYGKVPLFIGMGVAALTLIGAGGGWLFLGQQTTQLEAKQKDLDQKLGSLQAQDARLADLNKQVGQVNDETQSLASVFNQVQPWSAVLQDLRESIPQGVQIAGVTQSEIKATAPAAPAPVVTPPKGGLIDKISTPPNPEASPKPSTTPAAGTTVATTTTPGSKTAATAPLTSSKPTATLPADVPTTKIDITGTAKSFDEVNNFILTLKQSAFFNPDETQLLSAGLVAGAKLTPIGSTSKPISVGTNILDKPRQLELPKVVEYKIQTSLKRIPAADLIRELERKGAVGLVTRLKSLQQQQVIKP